MLHCVLTLLIVVTAHAEPLSVKVEYKNNKLNLLVPTHDTSITSVVFHYGAAGDVHYRYGIHTPNGWEYHGDLMVSHEATSLTVYADIHHRNDLLVTTVQTSINLQDNHEVILPPGARRIRAVLFRDDFTTYDKTNWRPEISVFGGMNWEFEVYTPEAYNIYAKSGNIYLHPTLLVDDPRWDENYLHHGTMNIAAIWGYCTNDGNWGCARDAANGMLPPIMSGKVSSNPSIRFGTVEVRAKISSGDWLWPAIWMMPKDSVYGVWPRSGEMDIMESRGNAGAVGVGTISSTLHWGPAWDQNKWDLTHGEQTGTDFHTAFHTYRLEWTQDYIRTFVDDKQYLNVDVGAGFWAKGGFSGTNPWATAGKSAPFDQDFYLILNVACGGTNGYFSDTANWGVKKPWANNSPHAGEDFWNAKNDWLPTWKGDDTALQVDYVEFRN